MAAVKQGGADPAKNLQLETLIQQAKENDVTKAVIENAIARGSGASGHDGPLESYLYEAMGPGGVALVVQALTSNRTRAIAQVKAAITKHNGAMSPVLYMFDRKGRVRVEAEVDRILDDAIDVGAEDVVAVSENAKKDVSISDVFTEPQDTARVAEELKKRGYSIVEFNIEFIAQPDNTVGVNEETMETIDNLASALEDLNDVHVVYTNAKLLEQ
ncbi:hypothetical protein CANCADRAFT_31472 [Tortispora caseinolytica NRRL Y-17796]|uniref:Transcriptional regulatory protein n=1 Tax=Tortispora caseinolytica NRRL Y-17796 TaxID=767744 RepID=A0A1E4TFL4_9ASCO|nr:hypothetical protein CANCADRAFT_31472 [Tortispora caseinolytica NRRL Y-17796]